MTEAPYNNNKLGIVVVLVSMVSVLAIFNSFSYNATAVTTTPSVGVQVG